MINPYVVIVCLLMMGSESGDLLERVQIFSELEGLKMFKAFSSGRSSLTQTFVEVV